MRLSKLLCVHGPGRVAARAALVAAALLAPAGVAAAATVSSTPSATRPYYACPTGGCQLIINPPAARTSGAPLYEGSGEEGGYSPEDLRSAYKIPKTGGAGQTVAVIDPFRYPGAQADLATYRSHYDLGACNKKDGCLKIVNQEGNERPLPPLGGFVSPAWQIEQALDLDMVSAVCPKCHILLVQANSQLVSDLAAAANEAAILGATEISNSYGFSEQSPECGSTECSQYVPAYSHPGIPVVAGSGDSGYDEGPGGKGGAPNFPASAPGVIAVGGTTLRRAANGRRWSEAVWSKSGSGCSLQEPKPAWQTDPGCPNRMTNDVAAIGDPETPVSVRVPIIIEAGKDRGSKWATGGGTSASAPLVAGILAHASAYTRSLGAEAFYREPGMLFDVTSGKNGECGTTFEYLCTGGIGYDGPTGWGTPDRVPEVAEP
jgi:subtilase family serine protease